MKLYLLLFLTPIVSCKTKDKVQEYMNDYRLASSIDSSLGMNTAYLSNVKTIIASGDSFSTGWGLKDSSDLYLSLLADATGKRLVNLSENGSGWWTTLYNLWSNFPGHRDTVLFTFLTGFNPLRHHNDPRVFNKIEGGLKSALASIYSHQAEGACDGRHVIKSGAWVESPVSNSNPTGFPSFARQVLGSNAVKGSAGSYIAYQTQAATRSIAVGYYLVGDSSLSADIRILVDGYVVDSLNTFKVDTVFTGGYRWANEYSPTAFYLTGLPLAVHQVKIEILSGELQIDWLGSLIDGDATPPVVVGLIPDQERSKGMADSVSTYKTRRANSRYISVAGSFPGVRVAYTNQYFKPDSDTQIDKVHPSVQGNYHIFQAYADAVFYSEPPARLLTHEFIK